ncbi:MAG: DUF4203 domain-containing protein [Planctomycetota bacterium]
MWEPDLGSFISAAAAQKVYLSACVLTGALMCFFGRRLFKLALGLFGALLGGYLAALIGFRLSDSNEAVALFCGLTGGVLGGVLVVAIYLLGVFVAGATLGGILAAVFTLGAGAGDRAIAISVVAAVGGFLALFVQRFIITVATALNGAALVIGCLWLLYANLTPADAFGLYAAGPPASAGALYRYFLVCGWATLGCLGAWVQLSAGEAVETEADEDDADRRGRRRPYLKSAAPPAE